MREATPQRYAYNQELVSIISFVFHTLPSWVRRWQDASLSLQGIKSFGAKRKSVDVLKDSRDQARQEAHFLGRGKHGVDQSSLVRVSNRSLGRSILPKQSSSSSWTGLPARVPSRDLVQGVIYSRYSSSISRHILVAVPYLTNARALPVQSPNDAFVSPLTHLHPHYVAYRKSPRGLHEEQGFLPRHDTYSPLFASSIGASLHRPIVPARLLCFRAVPEEGAPTAARANLSILLSSQA